ncbi:MAG: right-handed parallel beta-helix repeat-containing protein [Opitutaceae bacterium]|jgi:hypothetical protein
MKLVCRPLLVLCLIIGLFASSAHAAVEIYIGDPGYPATAVGLNTAFQACAYYGGGVVVVPGDTIVEGSYGYVSITAPGIHLKGSGTLRNLTLTIGKPTPELNPATGLYDKILQYNTVIEGVTFSYDSLQAGRKGIVIQNARSGIITNSSFINCDYAISVPPNENPIFQHVNQFQISNNRFVDCNYALRIDRHSGATVTKVAGDTHFINNKVVCKIGHIYGVGVDGLVVSGNSFFFPGWYPPAQSQTKASNIYLDTCTFIVITGNNLFEAGTDAIYLQRFENVTITGNNIAWPGQRIPGSAIKMVRASGTTTPPPNEINMSAISGNNIMWPSEHGISIGDNCGYVSVTGNQIREPGNALRYYGTVPLSSSTHYAVYSGIASSNVTATGNMNSGLTSPIGVFGVSSWVAQSNQNESLAIIAVPVDLTGFFGSTAAVTFAVPTTITTIVGGKPGQIVAFGTLNSNATFHHSGYIRLKGNVDTTLPAGGLGTLYLKCVSSAGNSAITGSLWVEVSRSY